MTDGTRVGFRDQAAVTLAHWAAELSTRLRLGAGTSLPGRVALAVSPKIIPHLGRQMRGPRWAVTGTNGKTTTSTLMARLLETAGCTVLHNALGANMRSGVAAALVRHADRLPQVNAAVLEIDEASLRGVAREVHLDRVVVTNLFRDQLDRYGELDTTAQLIAEGIARTGRHLVLNADDPLVAAMAPHGASVHTFGVDAVLYGQSQDAAQSSLNDGGVGFPREGTDCPRCASPLNYRLSWYGQLGDYACPSCGFQRPRLDVAAETVRLMPDRAELSLRLGETHLPVVLPLPGLFNVYNFLAAVAALHAEGIAVAPLLEAALAGYRRVFGRAEQLTLDGRRVWVMLIKNPAGASEVLKGVAADPSARLLIALNDQYADGCDVSWIWDAMFELVPGHRPVVVSGTRSGDMAVRLRYAGLPPEQIIVEPDLNAAVSRAVAMTDAQSETLYILPTYTALLALQRRLHPG